MDATANSAETCWHDWDLLTEAASGTVANLTTRSATQRLLDQARAGRPRHCWITPSCCELSMHRQENSKSPARTAQKTQTLPEHTIIVVLVDPCTPKSGQRHPYHASLTRRSLDMSCSPRAATYARCTDIDTRLCLDRA